MDGTEFESRITDIERKLSKLESAFERKQSPALRSKDDEDRLVENADKLKTLEMILISLKLNGKQTKDEVKMTLQDWGKVFGNWFDGGNFNGRLVKKNVVRKEGKNENDEDVFSLTRRGEMLADELIAKLKAG